MPRYIMSTFKHLHVDVRRTLFCLCVEICTSGVSVII